MHCALFQPQTDELNVRAVTRPFLELFPRVTNHLCTRRSVENYAKNLSTRCSSRIVCSENFSRCWCCARLRAHLVWTATVPRHTLAIRSRCLCAGQRRRENGVAAPAPRHVRGALTKHKAVGAKRSLPCCFPATSDQLHCAVAVSAPFADDSISIFELFRHLFQDPSLFRRQTIQPLL